MKETSATSRKLHQLSTPIKVNIEFCPKISSHDGLLNNRSIVSQTIGLLLSKQRIIQWNFHTSIPECAPKFWCPKQEMYCLH